MRRSLLAISLAACPLAFASACELQEVTIAEPGRFVVVESFLVAGQTDQWVALHGGGASTNPLVHGARVTLSGPEGSYEMQRANRSACVSSNFDPDTLSGGFGCYATPVLVHPDEDGAEPDDSLFIVRGGELYRLDVVLGDGSRLTGATQVPEPLELAGGTRHGGCYIPPHTHRVLSWRVAAGTSAYLVDMQAYGVNEALRLEGYDVDVPEPLLLRGLSVGSRDTTFVLPREIGTFDRFSYPEATLALQRVFPEGVSMWLLIAAVDQNFVNWARGGDFNPSGLIRVPSMRGSGGTGVFGSASTVQIAAYSRDDHAYLPLCGRPAPD